MLNDLNVSEMLSDTDVTLEYDEACDASNPRVSTFQEVSAAAYKIKSGILRTPCTVGSLRAPRSQGCPLRARIC